ncbi:uncharacterized protein [Aegilops tauschii subsp. strangulata]|uniref:uncharacterized protein n=1 Tax=Aegilops tauschii subsp. strangulata TaxID=200361 RepID=UPI003CC8994B
MEVVQKAWDERVSHTEPFLILHNKLKTTALRLSEWSKKLFSSAKVQLHAALLIILRLDIAQEERSLSPEERNLRSRLKQRVISLAVLERTRKRQCARIANLREGDANTKFFHHRINARRHKNHIHRIKHANGWVTEHTEKEKLVHDPFSEVMGRGSMSSRDFNWEELRVEPHDLQGLDDTISEEEVWAAIKEMPGDKAPGPDGFTGIFFKKCWGIIKHTVMRAVQRFDSLHTSTCSGSTPPM